MKRSFLGRLRTNGRYYLLSALILLLGVPLYQYLLLIPQGYSSALNSTSGGNYRGYLLWVGAHLWQFGVYRLLLIVAFALLLSLPFALFRIIVAQEILGAEEDESEEEEAGGDDGEEDVSDEEEEGSDDDEVDESGMPAFAWRGKGFAVIAAWSGLLGLVLYVLGTVASTAYVAGLGLSFGANSRVPENFATLAGIFALVANTAGWGLLAIATLFFGAMIARSGLRLWPPAWVFFSYLALALAALFSGSAVGVASAPTTGQSPLTTPAILVFAIWVLWLGIMLVRLKPET